MTLMFFVYWRVIHNFRSHYIGTDEQKFQRWWFKQLYKIRRISLFLITVLFMPVTRLILLQFECTTSDGASYLTIYPDRPCPSTQMYAIQYFAIIFGLAYILGIPFFFYKLIRTAVKMVDAHGFGDERQLYHMMLQRKAEREPDGMKAKKYRELETETRDHLRRFYVNEVKSNPMPQTYLYAAYERRFRYFKIIQMAQKLTVVIITMFVPSTVAVVKAGLCGGVLTTYVIVSAIFQPFNDNLEDIMDIISTATNSFNALMAMILSASKVNSTLMGSLLIIVNVSVLVIMVLSLLYAPIRKWRAKRRAKKALKEKDQENSRAELLAKPSASEAPKAEAGDKESKADAELENELKQERDIPV